MKCVIIFAVLVSLLVEARLDDVFPYECYFADIYGTGYLEYTCKNEGRSRRPDCLTQEHPSNVHMIRYLCQYQLNSLKLYAEMFDNFTNVHVLDTSYLKISTITPIRTESLQTSGNQVRRWHAVHNELTQIPVSILDWMRKLKEIIFSHNKIRSLNFKSLKNDNDILKVNCSHNEIEDIATGAFSTLLRLVNYKF